MLPEEITELSDLIPSAKKIIEFAGAERIFLFYGDMGAGKTTLIKAICAELGVTDTVSSPTFSIVNEYDSPQGIIYHFDFYRLKSETEALDLGYEDYLWSGKYCFIEWPEKISALLPEHYVKIHLESITEFTRKLSVSHH